jgi:inner membrane protein
MDPITHCVLGASCAQAPAGPGRAFPAAVLGGVSAMVPDLDSLITSPTDPLLFLEYHRHFTHALPFAPVGALICATALHRWFRVRFGFLQTYLFCLLGYASHGLLDSCTTFGTLLLWPFSDARIAWSNVAVVDPLVTAPIAALVLAAIWRRRALYARVALVWVCGYLLLGVAQGQRAAAAAAALAFDRGHDPVRLESRPALGSTLLWKTIYEYRGRYYVDAIRTGSSTRVYEGRSIAKLDVARDFPWLLPGSQQALDLERFRRLSADLLAVDADAPSTIIDLRYSLVPNEIDSLWTIELDPEADQEVHVSFVASRNTTLEQGSRLLEMTF